MARDPRILRLESIEDQYKADAIRQIAEARQRIARIVTAAAKDSGFKITGRNRDKLYGLVDAEYAKLEIGLRNWSKELVADGVKGGMEEAKRELENALGESVKDDLTKFSRQYAEDVFKIISPGNESQLAGVLTGKMSAADLSNLRKAQRDVFRQAALEGWTAKRKERELKDRWQLLAGGMEEATFTDAAGKEWDTDTYVNMLTRTTSARVWRDGYAESLVRHGDDLARVENVDGEACDVCQAWDGVIVSISGGDKDFPSYQQAIDAGVFHPNCVLGDTRIVSDDAELLYRFRYDGPIVEVVFASGRRLSVTPNHMLLTDHGFAFAQFLRKGDNVFCGTGRNAVGGFVPDDDLSVASIADVFSAANEANPMAVVHVPVATKDFHGDARMGNGDVDIIGTDGLLLDALKSKLAQRIGESGFCGVNPKPDSFSGASALTKFLRRASHSSDSSMGSRRESLALLWRSVFHPDVHGCAPAPDFNASHFEDSANGSAARFESIRKTLFGLAGVISPDAVVGVNVSSFSGHVYDLQCSSTMYIANGVLSSNCRCAISYIDPEMDADDIARQRAETTPSDLGDVAAVQAYNDATVGA